MKKKLKKDIQFSSVQLLSRVRLFATPWTAAHQASLSITNSRGLLKLKSIELVMASNHLILCRPLLLPSSIFPSIRVFSSESALCIRWLNYQSLSFSITLCNPMNSSKPGLPTHHQLPSLPKLMSIELVMPSSHLILCGPLLVLPPIPPVSGSFPMSQLFA